MNNKKNSLTCISFKNKPMAKSSLLITLLFIILSNSCTDEKYNEFEKSTTKKIRVFVTPMGYEYNTYYNESIHGTLVLTDVNQNNLEYDIINGENSLDVPFGFYMAKVKNFDGCAYNTLEILSVGGNKETIQNVYISKLEDLHLKIIDAYVYSERYLYFNTIVDSIPGFYKAIFWGTNVINPQQKDITLLLQSYFTINNSAHISIGGLNKEDAIFRFYTITIEPFNGFRDEITYNEWYEYTTK